MVLVLVYSWSYAQSDFAETFPPLNGKLPPQTVEELWEGFDAIAEPLDVEVLKEWEEEGVIMRVLRYRIGVFKGQKAMMGAIYGFPKSAKKLPALVQVHGGGQFADYRAVLANAKRGYATVSIAWAGRINAPDYIVDRQGVKLFWKEDTTDSNYKLTTDWGALDAYHAPHKNEGSSTKSVQAAKWTLDKVGSPRNNLWFLCAVGARRAITFLEQQSEVNPDKIGIYGHSMGGKITVLTAIDPRIKAAAPSCGGISDLDNEDSLFQATLADDKYLQKISCPIMFLSSSNDFHGHIYDLQTALRQIKTKEWRITCAAHHNHQDTPEFEAATLLWFDQVLKNKFHYPITPELTIEFNKKKVMAIITPDDTRAIQSVEVYYWHQDRPLNEIDRESRKRRFWHHATATKIDENWTAELPLSNTKQAIWMYANVLYQLDKTVEGVGYYYRTYATDKLNLSSRMTIVEPHQLKKNKIKSRLKSNLLIESFEQGWEKDWYSYTLKTWGYATHKINDDLWKAPSDRYHLALGILSEQANTVVIRLDNYATEVKLKGGDWQYVELSPNDFKNAEGNTLSSFTKATELEFIPKKSFKPSSKKLGKPIKLGGEWKGEAPKFRELRWIKIKNN